MNAKNGMIRARNELAAIDTLNDYLIILSCYTEAKDPDARELFIGCSDTQSVDTILELVAMLIVKAQKAGVGSTDTILERIRQIITSGTVE